ncbi:MAG: hypothetical protein ACRDV9_08380 [Acidimicrobiia bacterium]
MIVVDASSVVLGLLNNGEARRRLVEDALAAPHLVDPEVAHALGAVPRCCGAACPRRWPPQCSDAGPSRGPPLLPDRAAPPDLGATPQPERLRRQLRGPGRGAGLSPLDPRHPAGGRPGEHLFDHAVRA